MPSHPGPTCPTPDAVAALRPVDLDQVQLDPAGLLGAWQHRNASATLPHCVRQLDAGGALANLRRLVDEDGGPHRGMWFSDTDVYKTMEAAAWEVARDREGSAAARNFLERTAALLAEVQEDDGYLDSYFTADNAKRRWQEPHVSHELYCAGHLIQAAVAAARAGVAPQLTTVACRLADLLVRRFGPDGVEAVCGHPEIETALVELYRVTGTRAYLALAERFVRLRGHGLLAASLPDNPRFGLPYFQDHVPVVAATEVAGHAVRQLYLLAGVVDVAVETHDTALLAAAERLWDDAFGTRTYLTGAHGSRHRDEAFGDAYELPPDRAYAETCAAVASLHWNWRMLLATGRNRYADELERVLYNAIAGATATDGTHFFYSNPLQLRTGHDGSDEDAPSRRLPWYTCACCPPNLARLMASLHGYLATADPTGVQLHLYAAGTVRATVAGGPVALAVRTDYPWSGRIELTVDAAAADTPWTLALRIPSWCPDATATVDGGPVDVAPEGGYLRLTRIWRPGAVLVLDLAMPPRLVVAHPRVDAVRGCVALARGPLVYCVEQADLPAGVLLEDVRLLPDRAVVAGPSPSWPQLPVALHAGGVVPGERPAALYRTLAPTAAGAGAWEAGTPVELTAVPYFRWGNRQPGAMRVWVPVAGF